MTITIVKYRFILILLISLIIFSLITRGIAFTPVPIPSKAKPEPKIEIIRDSFRSLFWLLTGRTGASLKNRK